MRGMEMELGKRIGKRLRELREQRGWTQAEFAELTGKAVETISNMERGKSVPGLLTLEHFSRHLGVGLQELVRTDIVEERAGSQDAAVLVAAAKRLPMNELELVAGFIRLLDKQRRRERRSRT